MSQSERETDLEEYYRFQLRCALENMQLPELERFENFVEQHDQLTIEGMLKDAPEADLAFHKLCQAAYLLDHRIPFADLLEQQSLIDQVESLIKEALKIDNNCVDARRLDGLLMRGCLEERVHFLEDQLEVADYISKTELSLTKAKLKEAGGLDDSDYDQSGYRALAEIVHLAPLWRWKAQLVRYELLAGFIMQAIKHGRDLLKEDPRDLFDVHKTLLFAYAKLQNPETLEAFVSELIAADILEDPEDPWVYLAEIYVNLKLGNFHKARFYLAELLNWPHAIDILFQQIEVPAGNFSRARAPKGSGDELFLAVCEAAPLLQDGIDASERGFMGGWIIRRLCEIENIEELIMHE